MSTLSEKATLNFYEWESRGRGYYHFDNPVDIEPPYVSYIPITFSEGDYIDDGRVTLLGEIKKLIRSSPKEEIRKPTKILPSAVDPQPKKVCVGVDFPANSEIKIELVQEVLGLLSFSDDVHSFEILAQNGTISVQFTSSEQDVLRLQSHLRGFFPNIIIKIREVLDINFNFNEPVAIADFGLDSEFMLPIAQTDNLIIDPLTSIIVTLATLQDSDTAIFQVLFKGVTAPWSQDMQFAVTDGRGGSFFEGYPEFVSETKDKASSSLFAVVMRVGVQGRNGEHSRYVASELARSITSVSKSEHNQLIPLSNEGYKYDDHLRNIFYRTSNRLGFILNSKELAHFVHYPNKTIVNEKLNPKATKSKRAKTDDSITGIYIGENKHQGESYTVYLDTESRLSHTHLIGATGVGKSTLLANMMLADVEQGLGCAIFDPHGDICDDILKRIPQHRIDDVIIIDPSDSDFPIGFNLLEAHSEAEKIVLSSDLVSAFKRHATAWGDNMTAVLQNAINTILDSTQGGTLIELKRILIEEKFRNEYLTSVDDPSLHYYWQNEYPLVRKGIAPLLTRIDTFLRPKLIRYMLAQKKGVDIANCLNTHKIVLLKLSQGLIGEQNSYLLGSLFLAKFNQAALARQSQRKNERQPYMLYLDEFQNFITPSIERILSGARKYGLGLTLAHQELGQIQDTALLNSVLSNPKTRICFRLGDNDAKRLESGFSYFESSDLQSLARGEAIMRIGSSSSDFNITTHPLSEIYNDNSLVIISSVRDNYATPKQEVEALLISLLPLLKSKSSNKEKLVLEETVKQEKTAKNIAEETVPDSSKIISEKAREKLIKKENESLEVRAHTYLQSTIKKLGQDRNYIATIEYPTKDGGRIDIVLERDHLKIGFEISETNKPEYEVRNIKKCLKAGCVPVVMVSKNKNHLKAIQKLASEKLSEKDKTLVQFIQPDKISGLLDEFILQPQMQEEVVKGFRIVTEFEEEDSAEITNIKSRLAKLFKK